MQAKETTLQTASETRAQTDALFNTQPLAQALGHLRGRSSGLFKIESVHLPNILVDASAGAAYVAAGHVPSQAYGDLMVSVRSVQQVPQWVARARRVPLMELLWVAAESATPGAFSQTQRFAITRMPQFAYGPNYKYLVRLAALCSTQALSIAELTLLAGVSEQQAQRFLQACEAVGCLRGEADLAHAA